MSELDEREQLTEELWEHFAYARDASEAIDLVIAGLYERGWRVVKTGEDGIRHGSKPHVAIFEDWTGA